jgi:SAM-dependent methyltransferase
MPTSDLYNITSILTIVSNLKPKTILDIGCGFGKYGFLMREYLEVWQERLQPENWQTSIVGIDAFVGYHNPIWDFVYNSVHIGDAETILPNLSNFDVILIADVIEHFEKSNAVNLVNLCLQKADAVIVSTPKEFYPQGDSFGNAYEIHRCLFQAQDFPSDSYVITIPALSCNIFIGSRKPIDDRKIYPARFEDLIYLRQRHSWKNFGLAGAVMAKMLKFANSL